MDSTLIHQVATLFLLAIWWLIATGVGRLGLRLTGLGFVSGGEELFLASGIGLVVIAYAVFIFGCTQALYPFPILLLLTALGAMAMAGYFQILPRQTSTDTSRSKWDRPAQYLLGGLLLACLPLVLTPEIGKDALIYHLAVPKLYLGRHGFYAIPGNAFAGYPLLAEMHYLLALFAQNDILAKAMHFSLLGGTLLGIGLFSRHLLRENAFPALSMLIFVSIPSIFAVSHTAYNDLFVAFFTLAGLYAFCRWSDGKARGWLILCALFSGGAMACKYTALLLPPLGLLGILWRHSGLKSPPRDALRDLGLYSAIALITAGPFYLKSWILMGNPFYPFFWELFGGRGWDADQARLYDLFIRNLGMGRTLVDYLLLPWNLSFLAQMDSPRFDGVLGPVFLLTLPFLAGLRRWPPPLKVLAVFCVATFFFWASAAQQIRYLIPLFAPLAIVAGLILAGYRRSRPLFALLILIVSGSIVLNGYTIARDLQAVRPLPVAVGLESREDFLARRIPVYPMYRALNRELPPGSRILLVYMKNYTYLCERACYADAMFESHMLQQTLRSAASPEAVRDHLKAAGFTHLLYDERYLLGEPSPLSPGEKSLFAAFRDRALIPIKHSGPYRLEGLN
jgi:hypothetical protein